MNKLLLLLLTSSALAQCPCPSPSPSPSDTPQRLFVVNGVITKPLKLNWDDV